MYDKKESIVGSHFMNSKSKKILLIFGLSLDVLVTILLFVFSIIILVKMPTPIQVRSGDVDYSGLIGWFQKEPIRILLLIALPLAILLVLNVSATLWYLKKTGVKKKLTINDLTDEEKAALKQKILQEMMQSSEEKK
jgi:hypothetical protein